MRKLYAVYVAHPMAAGNKLIGLFNQRENADKCEIPEEFKKKNEAIAESEKDSQWKSINYHTFIEEIESDFVPEDKEIEENTCHKSQNPGEATHSFEKWNANRCVYCGKKNKNA